MALDDPALRDDLGRKGHDGVRERFTARRMAEETVAVLAKYAPAPSTNVAADEFGAALATTHAAGAPAFNCTTARPLRWVYCCSPELPGPLSACAGRPKSADLRSKH